MKRISPTVMGCLFSVFSIAHAALLSAQDEAPAAAESEAATSDKAPEAEKPPVYLRVLRNDAGEPIALETSIVRYVSAAGEGGAEVDLVGAVHIGDGLYHEKLNKQFTEYEVVLYELVAQQGEKPPTNGEKSDNPLAMIQGMMTMGLGLESQLQRIDYTKENFVHADMTPEEMSEAMRQRGDNAFTVGLSVIADLMREANRRQLKAEQEQAEATDEGADATAEEEDPFSGLFSLLLDPDGPQKMKRTMAEQFESADGVAGGLGPTLNTMLVEDRNKAALKVLQKQLASGKKKIAIFYGAAHMPDFEKRLSEEFGMKKTTVTWLTAWDLSKRSGPPAFRLFGE